jgi:hypothetical protein
VDRTCEPMDENRIEGAAEQGERARSREALVAKARWRKIGSCAGMECVLTWGDIALCLKGRRGNPEREVSRDPTAERRRAEREGASKRRTDMTGRCHYSSARATYIERRGMSAGGPC